MQKGHQAVPLLHGRTAFRYLGEGDSRLGDVHVFRRVME